LEAMAAAFGGFWYAVWRMAIRVGSQGPSLWPAFQTHRVAAIMYPPLQHTDLPKHAEQSPEKLWKELAAAQKFSLAEFAYEMRAGDTIYVKEGPLIVGKGTIAWGKRREGLLLSLGVYQMGLNGMMNFPKFASFSRPSSSRFGRYNRPCPGRRLWAAARACPPA